jgi:asparagine synthase (glutamine-hydrolysing)
MRGVLPLKLLSMATSLEARVPLLDYKMVEFAFSLPGHYKLGGPYGSTTKWFFKKAMEGILPPEIIYRQKEGFSIPIKIHHRKGIEVSNIETSILHQHLQLEP